MLCDKKALAKTSGKPGKTQHINHFIINDSWYLVDLPGYGWSKVSKEKKAEWGIMIEKYLISSEQLFFVFVLIDSRIPPQKIDHDFIYWLGKKGVPFAIIFTKSDKLSKNKLSSHMAMHKKELLKNWEQLPPNFISSSVTKQGKDQILEYIHSQFSL